MSYFTSCPHHRVLHSFPTRRSSDLWSSQTAFHCYSPRNSGLTPERLRKPLNRLRQPPADLRATTALPGSTAGGMSDVPAQKAAPIGSAAPPREVGFVRTAFAALLSNCCILPQDSGQAGP